jgi:pimeloyl-ACP methyl ester carboxylesterase
VSFKERRREAVAGIAALSSRTRANLDGQCIEYTLLGGGAPTFVLIAGSGGPIESWCGVAPALSALGTVLAYNRPGVGASDGPSAAQTVDVMTEALRALLRHAGLAPPFILVGHSLGGLIANYYARAYPAEIASVVLVEATAPEDVATMAAHASKAQRLLKKLLDVVARPDPFGEAQNAARSAELVESAGAFPRIPLVVVTGGKPAMSWATPDAALAARALSQRRLAELSASGCQRVAAASGHFPQLTEPQVVVEAVSEIVQSRRL